MSEYGEKFFVASLLYSNTDCDQEDQQRQLDNVLRTIKSDSVLSKIHLINVDNEYTQHLLIHNTSGISVSSWPIFAIRHSDQTTPKIYSLDQAKEVFDIVRSMYKEYHSSDLNNSNGVMDTNDSSETSDSDDETVSPIRHVAPRSSQNEHSPMPKSNTQPINRPTKPKTNDQLASDVKVVWNRRVFEGYRGRSKCIDLLPGNAIIVESTDSRKYDIVRSTKEWEIIEESDIDFRSSAKVGFSIRIRFNDLGVYYFVCSEHRDVMRLQVNVVSAEKDKGQQLIEKVPSIEKRVPDDKTKKYFYVQRFRHTCGREDDDEEPPEEDDTNLREELRKLSAKDTPETSAAPRIEYPSNFTEDDNNNNNKQKPTLICDGEDNDPNNTARLQSLIRDLNSTISGSAN